MNRVKIIFLIIFLLPLGTIIGCDDGGCDSCFDDCEGLGCLVCGSFCDAQFLRSKKCEEGEKLCAEDCIPDESSCCNTTTIKDLFGINDTKTCFDSVCCDSGDCADEIFLCPEVFECPEEYFPCGPYCISIFDSFGEENECQYERECDDQVDNDNDGSMDCNDDDCFVEDHCFFQLN